MVLALFELLCYGTVKNVMYQLIAFDMDGVRPVKAIAKDIAASAFS